MLGVPIRLPAIQPRARDPVLVNEMTENLLSGFWEGFLPCEELFQLLYRKRPGSVTRGTTAGGASRLDSSGQRPWEMDRGDAHAEARWRCPLVLADVVVVGDGFTFTHRNLGLLVSPISHVHAKISGIRILKHRTVSMQQAFRLN